MDNVKNILLVGVGGQGTILASKIFSEGMVAAGYDVKMSEIHGMSQRGGSVSTQIRYGKSVHSPIIGDGEADILVAFEISEAARYSAMIRPDGLLVINDYKIVPPEVQQGLDVYPQNTLKDLQAGAKVTLIQANEIATALGNPKAMNIVLLGALIKGMGLESTVDWNAIITKLVKPQFVELNQKALAAGLEAV